MSRALATPGARSLSSAFAFAFALVSVVVGVLGGASGCGALELAGGQLAMLNEQVPLSRAVAREPDPRRRRLLALVPGVVAFGRDVMQLRPRGS